MTIFKSWINNECRNPQSPEVSLAHGEFLTALPFNSQELTPVCRSLIITVRSIFGTGNYNKD